VDGVHVDSPGWRNTLRLLVLIGMGGRRAEEPVAVADEDEDTMFFVRLPGERDAVHDHAHRAPVRAEALASPALRHASAVTRSPPERSRSGW
jgi:hypothetical protein